MLNGLGGAIMIKKSVLYICSILTFMFLFGIVGLLLILSSTDRQTQENTTECVASIKDVEISVTERDLFLNMLCNEYSCYLNISTVVSDNIDINNIYALQTGDTIYFRVNNHSLDKLETTATVNVVSLRTDKQQLFSLSNYNDFMHSHVLYAKFALVFVVVVLSIIIVVLIVKLRRKTVDGSVSSAE